MGRQVMIRTPIVIVLAVTSWLSRLFVVRPGCEIHDWLPVSRNRDPQDRLSVDVL
jgi:hypothetical protein